MAARVFVSGHLDLTPEEFQEHYLPRLLQEVQAGSTFVVGDAPGADRMALAFLTGKAPVTVYHMFDTPRVTSTLTRGGFTTDAERDEAMTAASDRDVLWIRPEEETKRRLGKKYRPGRISGTEKNQIRRSTK